MSIKNHIENEELDMEWVHLILAARNMGLNVEDVRAFLRSTPSPARQVTVVANKYRHTPLGFISNSKCE